MIYQLNSSIDIKEIGKYPQTVPVSAFHKKAKITDYIGSSSDNSNICISIKFYKLLKQYLSEHEAKDKKISNDVYKMDWKKMDYVVKEGANQVFYDYKIVHINYPNEDLINYKQSEFIIDTRENYSKNFDLNGITKQYLQDQDRKFIEIKSREHYRDLNMEFKNQNENRNIIVPKLVNLNLTSVKDDIFRVMTPIPNLSGYYLSENLKNKIREEGFTGMEFKSLDDLNCNFTFKLV